MKQTSQILLYVDDNTFDQMILKKAIATVNSNIEVVSLENPELAIEYLDNSETIPFLIISDLNMPGMSGLDFAEKLKSDGDSDYKNIPFYIFSTFSEEGYFSKILGISSASRC